VLACVRPKGQNGQADAQIVLGCDDGRVRVLDAKGELKRTGNVGARPTCIRQLANAEGAPLVAIGTNAGALWVFLPVP
jgi:hypothetical protein